MDKVDKYLTEEMIPGEKAITDYLGGQRGVYMDSIKHAMKSLSTKEMKKLLSDYIKIESKAWKKLGINSKEAY